MKRKTQEKDYVKDAVTVIVIDLIILLLWSMDDIRNHSINIFLLAFGGIIMLCGSWIEQKSFHMEGLVYVLLFCMIVHMVTKIGEDELIIIMSSICEGAKIGFSTYTIALGICCLVNIVSKKQEVAFVPYILIGLVISNMLM